MCVCRSIFIEGSKRRTPNTGRRTPNSERLYWFGLRNFVAAVFAGPPLVAAPEIEHRLAEMLHDVAAIEINVFDERAAVIAVENDVLMFAGRPTTLDHDANRVRRTDRRVRHIRRNEECFALADEIIDDLLAFADAHFDVAFELKEILLGIDLMEIVPRIWTDDHHHKEVASVVEKTIANRWFEQVPV